MNRKTVGLIIPSLHLPWEDVQIAGIIDACNEEDLNLVILPGGRLDSRELSESSRNGIYRLINGRNIDGLILWTAGLSELVSRERLDNFIRSFESIPVVLLDCRHESYTHVYADSYHPMKELIQHLINIHGLSSIGYICGEAGHSMAGDRFQAYKDALSEAGIPFQRELVYEKHHSYDEEIEIRELINWYRGLEGKLQGVTAFNDTQARLFIDAMDRIGVKIPEDISLCAYDDTPNALYKHPYLSTVHTPFREMASRGIKALIGKWNGETEVGNEKIRSKNLIRESCGCSFENHEENRKNLEDLAASLGEKMKNLRLINSLRADLKASPDFREYRKGFNRAITDFLTRAGIPLCKIFLYRNYNGPDLYEYFSFSGGEQDKPLETIVSLEDIQNSKGITRDERFTFIVLPLFSQKVNFGFVLLEPGTGDGALYETLMYILGSHFEENRLLDSLQRQSNDLKTSNELLSTTVENLNAARNILVQSEKMAALSNLTGGIAHQINTPLGVAITAVSFLDSYYSEYRDSLEKEKTEKSLINSLEKSLPIITHNLKRVADLVSTFKNIAVENISGYKGRIVIDLFLKEQMSSLKALWNNRISPKVTSQNSFSIESYPGVLSQILSILVENSVKHGDPEEKDLQISLEIFREEGNTVIDYRDEGPGIPREVRKKIFDPFFSTKGGNQNPGLGLFIVHNLVVYKLRGAIELVENPDVGVCFRITLPG